MSSDKRSAHEPAAPPAPTGSEPPDRLDSIARDLASEVTLKATLIGFADEFDGPRAFRREALGPIRAALEALVRQVVEDALDDAHGCPESCPENHRGELLRRYGLKEER